MSDNLENILRKSLDAAERRRKGMLIGGILTVLIAGVLGFVMTFYTKDVSSQVILGITVIMVWTGGLAFLIMSLIMRNTRFILKSIDTLVIQQSDKHI
jgi:ABC-type uncharacterized transport system permease subunit